MNKLVVLIVAGAFAAATSAFAADPPRTGATDTTKTATTDTAKTNAQQEKMKTCNAKAGDKKGDERKAFMKTCLAAEPAKPENKMAMCNKKTAGMTKPEADKARSECMKAPA